MNLQLLSEKSIVTSNKLLFFKLLFYELLINCLK